MELTGRTEDEKKVMVGLKRKTLRSRSFRRHLQQQKMSSASERQQNFEQIHLKRPVLQKPSMVMQKLWGHSDAFPCSIEGGGHT